MSKAEELERTSHRRRLNQGQSSRCKVGHLYTFKTTDLRIARRFRRKQFLGGLAEITIEGSTVRGAVHAVMEDASATPARWIITIVSSDSFSNRSNPLSAAVAS